MGTQEMRHETLDLAARTPILVLVRKGHGDRDPETQAMVAAAVANFFLRLSRMERTHGVPGVQGNERRRELGGGQNTGPRPRGPEDLVQTHEMSGLLTYMACHQPRNGLLVQKT